MQYNDKKLNCSLKNLFVVVFLEDVSLHILTKD